MKFFKTLIPISLSMVCLVGTTYGQTDILDFSNIAYQMSNTFPGGSARINGLGGAQTALGGDISSASSNPAGLGFFNRSEFTFTPNFNYVYSQGDYLGTTTNDAKLNFNFSNLGVVLNKTKGDIVDSKWRGGNFGISINRIADFQNEISYQSSNPGPMDFIESAVSNTDLNVDNPSFRTDPAELAYNIGLTGIYEDANNPGTYFVDRNIYAVDNNGNYLLDNDGNRIPGYTNQDFPAYQRENVKSKGASYQLSLAYGGNYNDKFYFGGNIGIISTGWDVDRVFTEEPSETDLGTLSLSNRYNLSGIGVNATGGIIYRPLNSLLLGLSCTTPTVHALEETQETTLTARFIDGESYDHTFTYDPFRYSLTTPWKVKTGLTYFFNKRGFISADIERVNFSSGKFYDSNSSPFDFSDINNRKTTFYKDVINFRSGAEVRFGKFRVRGGFAYLSDPVDDDLDQSVTQVSFGGGMRTENYYVDLGIANKMGAENTISPYPNAELAKITTDKTSVSVSVGWFF